MCSEILLAVLLGHLLGCLNPAWLIAKLKRQDIKQLGNGNAGASNTAIQLGLPAGIAVAIFDIAKAAIACILAVCLFPDTVNVDITAANAAVIGHMYPFWLKFRGGKGFACFVGLTACVDWKLALILALTALILVFFSDYIIAATILFISALPAYLAVYQHNFRAAASVAAISIIIFIKHIENFKNIAAGTEPKIKAVLAAKLRKNQNEKEKSSS